MKHDLELKVQAWVDGQLHGKEARRIGEWIAREPEAAALAAELRGIRQAISGNETPVTLGEPRPFYWSKIQRQIERDGGARRSDGLPWHGRWRRWMASVAGMAALGCVLVLAIIQARPPTFDEISSVGDGMEVVTFHDQSAQLTVVWLQDNNPAAEDQPAAETTPYQDENDISD